MHTHTIFLSDVRYAGAKGAGPGTTKGAGSVTSTMKSPFGKRVVGRGGKR